MANISSSSPYKTRFNQECGPSLSHTHLLTRGAVFQVLLVKKKVSVCLAQGLLQWQKRKCQKGYLNTGFEPGQIHVVECRI